MGLVVIVSPVLTYFVKTVSHVNITTSYTANCVLTTCFVFVLIRSVNWKGHCRKWIELISKNSFGIYLAHMLFMYPFRLWIAQYHINYVLQIPITVLCIGIVSFCFVWIVSKIPFGKYIVG